MASTIPHSLIRRLRAVPILEPLDEERLLRILGDSANLLWPAGTTVFEVGEESEGLYIVLSGRLRILDEDGQPVAEVERGGYVGERSLLARDRHSRTVEALEDAELMTVPARVFDELLEEEPHLEELVRQRLEERMSGGQDRPD
jgi:CRP-like cAMP-binding protein